MLATCLGSQTRVTHNVITTLAKLWYLGFTIEGYLCGDSWMIDPWMNNLHITLIRDLT